jgi:hypothetical protein
MNEYKVGDEVEVYNPCDTRVGKIVAILTGIDRLYPIVVEHGAFGRKNISREEQAKETRVYQRFSYHGTVSAEEGAVRIRRPKEYRILLIHDRLYMDNYRWCLEEFGQNLIAKSKAGSIKGFLRGEYDSLTDKISNVVYTTLEG